MCHCLSINSQLNELRLLLSIFPDQLVIDDKEIKQLVSASEPFMPQESTDGVNQVKHNHPVNFYYVQKGKDRVHYEIYFSLDREYPEGGQCSSHVRVYGSKEKEKNINQELTFFIDNSGLPDVYKVISWVNDWMENLTNDDVYDQLSSKLCTENSIRRDDITCTSDSVELSRLWIFSHHIYDKNKRKTITDGANQLHLTGFMRSGKPGFICLEGPEYDAENLWKQIKGMRWQKICLIEKECSVKEPSFSSFEEISLNNSEFLRFLEDHKMDKIIREHLNLQHG